MEFNEGENPEYHFTLLFHALINTVSVSNSNFQYFQTLDEFTRGVRGV